MFCSVDLWGRRGPISCNAPGLIWMFGSQAYQLLISEFEVHAVDSCHNLIQHSTHSRQWPTHAITRCDLRSAGEFIMPSRRLTRRQFDGDDNANGNNKFSFQGLASSVSQMSPLSCRWAGEAALRWRSGQAAGGRRQRRWDYWWSRCDAVAATVTSIFSHQNSTLNSRLHTIWYCDRSMALVI